MAGNRFGRISGSVVAAVVLATGCAGQPASTEPAASAEDEVTAVDLNPLCVKTTRRNVELNKLSGQIVVANKNAELFSNDPADLVIANIHWAVIERLLGNRGFENSRWLIVSGLMRSQRGIAKERIEDNGFRVYREWDHEMTWFTLLAKRERSIG